MSVSISRRGLLAAAAATTAGCWRKPKPGFSGFAFVANEEGHAIAAVDLTALAVVRHVRLNAAPSQLISHGPRRAVYALTPATGAVHEISASHLQRERLSSVCSAALGMSLGARDSSLWILARHPQQLVELRLDTFKAGRRIPLPHPAADFDLSIGEPQAVVSFGDRGAAGLADLETGKVRLIECGSAIGPVRFRKDGRQWIAGHRDRGLLSIFDTASGRILVRLPLAMRPGHFCFKADGGQLFVTGEGMDAVAIVFPYSTEVAETVLAGNAPGAMAASPVTADTPEYLFVTNPRSGQVTILNIESRKVLAVTQVGAEPSHVTITPDNQYALVLNRRSGDMAVILIPSAARRTRFPAALLTMIPVGSKPVSAVVQAV